MLLADAIVAYVTAHKQADTLAISTVKNYAVRLRFYYRWAVTQYGALNVPVEYFTFESVDAFLKQHRGQQKFMIFSTVYALQSFGNWLVKDQHLPGPNPIHAIDKPPMPKSKRVQINDTTIRAMLDASKRLPDAYESRFFFAILNVFTYGGLRRSELIALRMGDIDFQQGTITVRHGKGGKFRIVPPYPACLDAIREYLKVRPAKTKDGQDWLFVQKNGGHLAHEGLHILFEKTKTVAGFSHADQIVPHGFRHACATRLLRQGYDLEAIRVFLGHSSIATTALYLHADVERLKTLAPLGGLMVPSPMPVTPIEPKPLLPDASAPIQRRRVSLARRRA